ncbi:MAG: type II CRISPR-associated endonuclease Cas1 [Coriobacteriaceae bacterium]|jgi:CRISPR-associated endonuclease Cas1 subtype II|nr:type II CRISPR-associated endonuclease Cas1 [Coriobacteriaceae bacterium]
MATSGFRELIIASKALLTYSNNWLVVRSHEGTKKVFLDEVEVVIIENPASSITAYCAVEMAKRNIKLVFCDEKHNPVSEALPLYGSYDCAAKLKAQTQWEESRKAAVWQAIICQKISHQAALLAELGCDQASAALQAECQNVMPDDSTNREGMAARIYFNAIFGLDFNRQRGLATEDLEEAGLYNAALNYGYAILTSLFNRYVVAAGYSTQLGIFHRGAENQFNLSCDLMEPYRSIVDREVLLGDMATLDAAAKYRLANLIFAEVTIDGTRQTLDNAVPIYLRSVFDVLGSNTGTILDYEL